MKTKNWTFLLLALCVCSSCGNQVSSISSSSEASSTSSFVSSWKDEGVAKAIEASIQYDIPYLEADSYIAKTDVDEFLEPELIVGMNFEDEEKRSSAMNDYYQVCESEGWMVEIETVRQPSGLTIIEYECGYADKVISEEFAIEIQFVMGKIDSNAKEDQLCLLAFSYVPVDSSSWPSALLEHYLGFDIPHYEENGLTYQASVSMDETYHIPVVDILISGANENAEKIYHILLENAGYQMDDSSYEESGYYAFAEDNSHAICFYASSVYGFVIYVYPLTEDM